MPHFGTCLLSAHHSGFSGPLWHQAQYCRLTGLPHNPSVTAPRALFHEHMSLTWPHIPTLSHLPMPRYWQLYSWRPVDPRSVPLACGGAQF